MKGSVQKRGNKWSFVIDIGIDEETGKRKQKRFSGFKTKKEAEKAMSEKIHELNTGTFIEPTKVTLESYLLEWLSDKESQIRQSTWKSYRWLITKHIIPNIGKIKMEKLKPQHINNLYQKLQAEISPSSIVKLHAIFKDALNRSVEWGMIPRNVAQVVKPPRKKNVEMQVWEVEEVAAFLEESRKSRLYIAFLLAITTGMRQGEILGLRWQDIDFKNNKLSVRQTLAMAKSGFQFQEPKTDYSKRTIALDTQTIAALKAHRAIQNEEKMSIRDKYQDHDLVVATSLGTPVTPRNLSRTWYKLLGRVDVPKIRFHDLRHTHATLLLKQGVHPKIVSERLGHSSINITLDTYSHVLPNLQSAAAKELGDILFGKPGVTNS